LIGTDIGESTSKQPTAQPPKKCGESERSHLRPVGVNPDYLSRQFVIPYRLHGVTEFTLLEPPDTEANHPEHPNAKGEVGAAVCERETEQARTYNSRDTVWATSKRGPIRQYEGKDLLETDRHHREIMSAES
jgi:hypothetical protein